MTRESNSCPLIEAFAEIVVRFCNWAESPFGEPIKEMSIARKFLAELQLSVLDLPDLEPAIDYSDSVPPEKGHAVCARFRNFPVSGYWDVFNPLDEAEHDAVYNDLADDLSDIYRDLKEGLRLYERGLIAEAVWEWKFNHLTHWGAHLTGGQRAIHQYFEDIDE